MPRTVHLVSLGCPKNLIDSEVMLGLLQKDGYVLTDNPAKADVIVVNTCSFVLDAKRESVETVLELSEKKKPGAKLVVSGCLPQLYGKKIAAAMPEAELFLGTGEYHRIADLLRVSAKSMGKNRVHAGAPGFIHSDHHPRAHTGPAHTGWLKISEGCSRRCAFCVIPRIRGNVRSRTVVSLVKEARALVSGGVRELNLVAQDLTEYGRDLKSGDNLEKLLPALCRIKKLEWIRLLYVYPDDFSDRLVDMIAGEPKIVKYIDIPLQHTCDRILKSMRRGVRKRRIHELVSRLRERVPGIVIRTSIIVGFPGETKADFRELCRDLATLDLDRVGVFPYSREEGTPAAKMAGQVARMEIKKREAALLGLLQKQSLARQSAMIGRRVRVVIEGGSGESEMLLQARMSTQAPGGIDGWVYVTDVARDIRAEELLPGRIFDAEITSAMPHDLTARVIGI
ncbi:MAG: ribosomal protein S12 methylthiotransferase RimO [Bdellovibrionales bacterium RIFOXYD1_FULL_53_11]|nr:MAG: ribosomal protein S12 methylthiotransferase RimO [Bdellovibrionales bacterium RIFOXYD1_FULL_53_11]